VVWEIEENKLWKSFEIILKLIFPQAFHPKPLYFLSISSDATNNLRIHPQRFGSNKKINRILLERKIHRNSEHFLQLPAP
jgi:hypothetical protein